MSEKGSSNEEEYRRAVKVSDRFSEANWAAHDSSTNPLLGAMAQDMTRLMTREQVADFIISELREYESKGLIAPPSTQTISKQAKRQAMFCHIKSW